jgi:hypothetical protein
MDAAQIQESIAAEKKRQALRETDQKEEWAYSARIRKNFDDLGISLRTYKEGNETLSKIEKTRVTDMKIRQAAEKELNKILEENAEGYKDLSKAGKEKYKNDLKNEVAMTKAYASTGRYYDATGKLVKETDGLTMAQRAEIAVLKEHDRVVQQMSGNVAKFGGDLGKLAIKSTFDMFVAGIKGAYAGTIAYQDAILEGAGANTAAAAQVAAQMDALASAMESTGTSMVSLGAEAAKTALEMIILGGPIGILVGVIMLLVGAVVAYEGYEKQSQAAKMKRDAELQKKQAAIYDELYKDFTQLSQASLTGAGGMTELWSQMNKVGMSVKDFAKFNKVLVESASAMATFGSSAVEGVRKFVDVAGGVVHSGLGKIFRDMGMTNEDLADHTAKYMEQQARLGLMQGKSVADLQKGTANYIFELDRVATLTGQSRKEQEKARDAVKQIQQLRAAQFMARDKGDTAKANELATAENFAAAMMKVDPQLAAGIAKRASGAALDQDSVLALRNIAPALEAMRNGETDISKLMLMSGRSLQEQQRMYAGSVAIQGQIAGITANMAGTDDLVLQTAELNKKQDDANKKGEKFDPSKYLDKLREVTDPFTKTQAKIAQDAKETQIAFEHNVMGLSTELPNIMGEALKKYLPESLSGPIMEFFTYVKEFGKAVAAFAGHPLESTKEFFTGKDKAQRDAEELQEVSKKIEGLKKALGNPDEAKKLAEDNLKLAKKEFEEKDKAVTDLNIAYNKERDINKKKEIEQKQILAEDAREAARRKREMAETSLSDAEKVKRFNNPEKFKKELMGLEARQKELTESVRSNGPSRTAVAGNPGSMGMGGGGGGAAGASKGDLADSGLKLKPGDVQRPGAKVDPRLIEIAKKTQANVPGFIYFSGFNDSYHDQNVPTSRHTKGLAFDFTVDPGPGLSKPSKEKSDLIIDLLKGYGAENVKNEYDNPSKQATGGHFHAELPLPKGYDGGIFDGPKAGFPVELHGREAIVPLPNPGDKISIDKAQKDSTTSATKGALSSVVADSTTSSNDNGSTILMDLYAMMEEKFDDLIDKMDTNNKYTDKILKYSQV